MRNTKQEESELGSNTRRRMKRAGCSARAWVVLLLVFTAGVTADLYSKTMAFERIGERPVELDRETILRYPDWNPPIHEPTVVIPGVLQFRMVLNRGAVFGIGPGHRWFFVVFTMLAVVAALSVFAFRTGARQLVVHAALACILAGAIGNVYDRIRYGAVRDFVNMFPDVHLPFGWHWGNGSPEIFPWVYNVADMLLLCGIGLLMVRILRSGKKASRVEGTEPETV